MKTGKFPIVVSFLIITLILAFLSGCDLLNVGNSNNDDRYRVYYDGNGSNSGTSPVDAVEYASGDSTEVKACPDTLIRTGHTFSRWNTARDGSGMTILPGSQVFIENADIYLYAQWSVNSYTLSYDGNGNDSGSVPTGSSSYDFDTGINILGNTGNLGKTGHTFQLWNSTASGTGTLYNAGEPITMPAYNLTLYAQWTRNYYTISYDGNNNTVGSAPASVEKEYAATIQAAANTSGLARANYVFRGWNTRPDGLGTHYDENEEFSVPAEDIVLYAEWESIIGTRGPAGGYIFYDKGYESSGWRYLEAAPGDIVEVVGYTGAKWGPNDPYNLSGTQRLVGYGESNTNIFVNRYTSQNYAANLCYSYTLNGFSDWFLPSLDEVQLMYDALFKASPSIGGFSEAGYWSSTQSSSTEAYRITFTQDASYHSATPKWYVQKVRPVRAY